MNSNKTSLQTKMHMDFFDRTELAINSGFYLEAIFREYAAIEGRLEVILGLLGLPCNNKAPDKDRRDIQLSHRINCLKIIYKSSSSIGSSKIDPSFFTQLDKWRNDRNIIVHGYYKNELKYHERSSNNKLMATDGLVFARKLYNEVKRLRRYKLSHPEIDITADSRCYSEKCSMKQ